MDDAWVRQIGERYIELYEKVTGMLFERENSTDILSRIEENILRSLSS